MRCAPLQVQVNLAASSDERFGLSSSAVCISIISAFSEAAEITFMFSKGANLHRLYDKVLAIVCSHDTSHRAVRQLCGAARQGGYFTKVIATSEFFHELLEQSGPLGPDVSEAWLTEASDRETLEQTWMALISVGSSVVLVDDPGASPGLHFLDYETVSGSPFRIVSPGAFASVWPLEFVVEHDGTFSYPLTCTSGGEPISTLGQLLAVTLDSQQQVPADGPRAARSARS